MRVGLATPLPAYTIDPAFMGRKAEELGFDSLWYAEHPATPVESNSPFPATGGDIPITYSHFDEPYIALARASGVTSKILLGTGIGGRDLVMVAAHAVEQRGPGCCD